MKAMVINKIGTLNNNWNPLELVDLSKPKAEKNEILIKLSVCGVCHTELDEIEGRTLPPVLPVVPGHQAVGIIEKTGTDVRKFNIG